MLIGVHRLENLSKSTVSFNMFNVIVATHTWISPSVRGEGPEAREGHTAALIGKRLFIFGGCGKSSNDSDEVYYNDLYILNTGKSLCIWLLTLSYKLLLELTDSHFKELVLSL